MSRGEDGHISHWTKQKENATIFLCKLLMTVCAVLPRCVVHIFCYPVSLIYYICLPKTRVQSRRYLERVFKFIDSRGADSGEAGAESAANVAAKNSVQKDKSKQYPTRWNIFKHIASFAFTVVDKIEAWAGRINLNKIRFQGADIEGLMERLERKQGALLICSHLGNAELLRALADYRRTGVSRDIPVISIVDFSITSSFNRMLSDMNPASMNSIIHADNIGVETISRLQDCIDTGGLVVIAGDRTPANNPGRRFSLPFLGENAPFAEGPFYLAALLNTAVYFVFALRHKPLELGGGYDMYVHEGGVSFDCPRSIRQERIGTLARAFAGRLEEHCAAYPYEWFNFYDFWNFGDEVS